MAALILVDLQVDFLSSTPDHPARIDVQLFINLLPGVLGEFTSRRRPVIWARNAYTISPLNTSFAFPAPDNTPNTQETIENEEQKKFESYLTQTHGAGRFCRRGTPDAAIHPGLAQFKQNHHIEVIKTWYSSFTDTNLDQILKENDTTDIFIAGVTTNTCVAATTAHALQ